MIDLRSTTGDHAGFEYVEIASNGTDGMSKWINLFFNGEIIALVDNDSLADQIKQLVPKMTLSESIVSPVDKKAITLTELQEIARTKWIRPKKRDPKNTHMDTAKYNLTLTVQDGEWHFIWGSFLLKLSDAEYADTYDASEWASIELNGRMLEF